MKCRKLLKQAGSVALVLALTAAPCYAATDASAIEPVPGPHGYFVDTYKTNSMDNMTPESNAVIGVLSPFLTLWQPGDSWDNGTKLGDAGRLVLDTNIQRCIEITNQRTKEQELPAYLTDRQNQNWSSLKGLGPYETAFKELSHAATSLPDEIPADAETKKYSDKGGANGEWADTESQLGSIVKLVNTIRGPHASGNPAKIYFQYMRPFRWSSQVNLLPALKPCASDPIKDGGFPSGHTNAGYLASLSLAYAVPERYQQCLTNASVIGNYRIVAGMHSLMDVMGGRTMATALAAAALYDPENAQLKADARKEAQTVLLPNGDWNAADAYADYQSNRKQYEERLTYGMPQTGEQGKPMVVPKGAEVLLETRFPYLDSTQRRWVLYSTGLPSGYAFLDDAEGWGRLNLFAASAGYGSLPVDVTVTMDASKGGFSSYDVWQNDIYGEGCITKNGSGTLVLSGNNCYTGGVHVNGGTFTAASSTAFGLSSVDNHATISEMVDDTISINGSFSQTGKGVLQLDVNTADDTLTIGGTADLGGVLKVDFTDYPNPESGMVILTAGTIKGSFSSIQTTGLAQGRSVAVEGNKIVVK